MTTTGSSRRSFRDRSLITTPAYAGAAFGTIGDGDLSVPEARTRVSGDLGIADEWAWMRQVHGGTVLTVSEPGPAGEADALTTSVVGLPLAVRSADCVPVVVHADKSVVVVHAGWRGLVAGVIPHAVAALTERGDLPRRAAIGPAIGPCCYEVGDEVVEALGGKSTQTSWGAQSVDLWTEAANQLMGLDVWQADLCTNCENNFHSYRETGTELRQTTVGWL